MAFIGRASLRLPGASLRLPGASLRLPGASLRLPVASLCDKIGLKWVFSESFSRWLPK
jgi:hypothetical protein